MVEVKNFDLLLLRVFFTFSSIAKNGLHLVVEDWILYVAQQVTVHHYGRLKSVVGMSAEKNLIEFVKHLQYILVVEDSLNSYRIQTQTLVLWNF